MSVRPNAESRLVSALVNSQDAEAASRLGIAPEMLVSYQPEYRFVLSFPATFGKQPSVESLRTKFPDFPYSEAYTDVAFICSEVRKQHDHRTLVKAARAMTEALYDQNTEEAYAILQSVAMPGNSMSYEMRNALHDMTVLDDYGKAVEKLQTPWEALQACTGGMARGDLWYLAARLGQGKSWSLGTFARQALLAGKRVAYFSLEMPREQVLTRIHTLLAYELGVQVRHSDLQGRTYDPIAYRKLIGRIKEEIPGELFIVDTSRGGISPSHVGSMGRGMDLVLVDYAGLLSSPLGGRAVDDWRTMAMISNILKETAISNDQVIISAAQINREGDTPGWRPPKVKNLAQADALGQDADVVVTHKQRSKTVMIYSVEKNRHGEGGAMWHTRFLPNEGRFEQVSTERAKDFIERDREREEAQE